MRRRDREINPAGAAGSRVFPLSDPLAATSTNRRSSAWRFTLLPRRTTHPLYSTARSLALPGGLVACLGPHQGARRPPVGDGADPIRSDPIRGIPALLELELELEPKGAIDDGACPLDPISRGAWDGRLFFPGSTAWTRQRPAAQVDRLLWKERNKHMFSSERRMAQDVIFAILKKGSCEGP